MATNDFQVIGKNPNALFSLKIHRGEGMALIAMDWKNGNPPNDFVGFSIEYKYPGGDRYYPVKNRITFEGFENDSDRFSSLRSPIQKFRWIHFPSQTDAKGPFMYRVSPVFMNSNNELRYGEHQEVSIVLHSETYPNQMNVTFTRGFVASQAFIDRFVMGNSEEDKAKKLSSKEFEEELKKATGTLLPPSASQGLNFVPTHPKATEALKWMGFEARSTIVQLLDDAIADARAKVYVVAFDLSEKGIVDRFVQLGNRLKIIIDDSKDHIEHGSGENQAEVILAASAGGTNVKRQHLGNLQHNKMIVVDSPNRQAVVFGSTNFSWRGFFVQANNALIVQGQAAVSIGKNAFDNYWNSNNDKGIFGATPSALWNDLQLPGIDAKVAFSPHNKQNALLETIADDVEQAKSSVFYSLAFLHLISVESSMVKAINTVTNDPDIFVYGMADKRVKGIVLQKPDGKLEPVFASRLSQSALPEPFKSEASGGGGTQLHHKFIVLDFDKPSARVYIGSYNFSDPADRKNGENLLLIKDRKIAVSYMIEAVRLFDHYHFRVKQQEATTAKEKLFLAKPPQPDQDPWWKEAFTDGHIKSRDRKLFA